jgi:hypothetical protein
MNEQLQDLTKEDFPIYVKETKIFHYYSKDSKLLGLVLKMDAKMKSSLNTKANYLVWNNDQFLGQFFTSKEVSAQLS